MIPWPVLAVAGVTLVSVAGFAFSAGATLERVKWYAAEREAAKDADKIALDRIAALGDGLLAIDTALATRDAAQLKGLNDVRKAVAANRPPADGCRLDADSAERVRNVIAAANANRNLGVRDGTDRDEARVGPRD